MITLNRILVAHDFGTAANAAMTCAAGLATTVGATCDVLHVTGREKAGGDPRLQYRSGIPHEEIVRYARERNIDLIVMGTHGRSGLSHAVLGSVAERVVRTAPCPVLTVHSAQREFLGANILVPTDLDAVSDSALAYGRTLAYIFGARLHLLHVMGNRFMRAVTADPFVLAASARRQLVDRLSDDDHRVLRASVALDESDSPAQAILDFSHNTNIDLIVMGTHGRQAMERFFIGSVAERVLRTASCPVLTVRHPPVRPAAERIYDSERAVVGL